MTTDTPQRNPAMTDTPEQIAEWKRLADAATEKGTLDAHVASSLSVPALIAAVERLTAERDALKEALTNSCDLLENYIDTFGDMSGANRADLDDYRKALEASK